jgi:hypothetical protein
MHEFVASMPTLVQLGLMPAIGILLGTIYALLSRHPGSTTHDFAAKVIVATLGAVLGGFMFANYLAAAFAALLAAWLVNRLILKNSDTEKNTTVDDDV